MRSGLLCKAAKKPKNPPKYIIAVMGLASMVPNLKNKGNKNDSRDVVIKAKP